MLYAKLSSFCTKIGSGATPKGGASVYVESGVALIRSQNVYNLTFSQKGLTHITDDAAKKLAGVTVISGDVLLNITGDSVARVCMVPDDVLPARVNQHVAIIRTKRNLSPLYLMYYLASPYMQSYMLNLARGKGASRNALTKGMIENFIIPSKSIEEQNNIVSILSTYDDLIENNNKRIQILEKMAENLYKEWFVRFRFPGHETAVFENGIPRGWKRVKLNDMIDFNPSIKKTDSIEYKIIPMSALSTSSFLIDDSLYEVTDKLEGCRSCNGDTLLARITPCLENGKTGFVYGLKDGEVVGGSTEFIVMRAKTISPFLVYFIARDPLFRNYAIASMNGADGRQRVKVKKLEKLQWIRPARNVNSEFNEKCGFLFELIYKLHGKNKNLIRQRDLLLPRLMNGTLEI